ncbi:MAG: HNH endonuclease [Cenarchaeum sp. SB0669_bin_11]|nr:HNH endonuclease [Cenarchaeum sp. SB0669_bin_11]
MSAARKAAAQDRRKRRRILGWRRRSIYTRAARAFLEANPLCRACERAGRRRQSTQVDHRTPAVDLVTFAQFMDTRNWDALCTGCHAEKSRAERDARRPPPPADVAAWQERLQNAGKPRSPRDRTSLPSFPAIGPDSAGRD